MPPTTRSNRRQTLGVISNTARRRDSVEPSHPSSQNAPEIVPKGGRGARKSRVSMIPRMAGRENTTIMPPSPSVAAATQSSRRRSVAPGGDNRRKTMGGGPMTHSPNTRHHLPPTGGASAVVRTDNRPIHDKSFQQESIRKLHKFLLEQGYEFPITQKSLTRPSGKDFSNIVTFMLRLVDPAFQRSTGGKGSNNMKFEDEVAMNFKALGYPFPISKTALVAAGSPHTWPTLLAVLTWLMELMEVLELDMEEEIDIQDVKPFDSIEELQITTDKLFFAYVEKAYTAYMENDDAERERLEEALVHRFEQDDGFIEQEIERVTDLNAAMVERMTALMEDGKELEKVTKMRDDYVTDLGQFRDLLRQMEDHIAALNQKVDERTKELGTINKNIDRINGNIDSLKQNLEKQAVSVGDIYKLQSELKGVEEAMERASKVKEKLRKSKWESEENLAALFTKLEGEITSFNATLSEVALLPDIDDRVLSLKVALDKAQALNKDQSKLLGVDLSSVVHATLTDYKVHYIDLKSKTNQTHQQAIDDLESFKEKLLETSERLTTQEAQKVKMEETIENDKKTLEAKLDVRLKEVNAIETSVDSINDPVALEEQLARYERQCAELETLRLKQQEENLANKKAVEIEIEEVCQAVMELESYCKAKAAEVNQYILMKMTMNSQTVGCSENNK